MNENIVHHLRDVLELEPEEIPSLYQTFLRSFGECAGRLRAAVAAPDYVAIRAATHTLMGFARNIGANDLGDAALALNRAAHAADPAACALGVREIEELLQRYQAEAPAPASPA